MVALAFIAVQAAYAIVCIAEAWLEVTVIALKNAKHPGYKELNRQEHRRSAVFAVLYSICCTVTLLCFCYYIAAALLVPLLLLNRRLFFDAALKKMRGRKIRDIEGDQPTDEAMRWLFGKRGGWLELISLIVSIVASNILLNRLAVFS